jgi:hypothetical protein
MEGNRKFDCSFEDGCMLQRFGRERSHLIIVVINIVISHERTYSATYKALNPPASTH